MISVISDRRMRGHYARYGPVFRRLLVSPVTGGARFWLKASPSGASSCEQRGEATNALLTDRNGPIAVSDEPPIAVAKFSTEVACVERRVGRPTLLDQALRIHAVDRSASCFACERDCPFA